VIRRLNAWKIGNVMETQTLSQADFARHRGVSKPCVTIWKRQGKIVMDGRKVDVAASEALLDSRPLVYRGGVTNRAPSGPNVTRASHSEKPKPKRSTRRPELNSEPPAAVFAALAGLPPELIAESANWSLADAQKQKERYLALLRRHEYELKSGAAVSAREVELFLAARHGAIRDKILGWPGKMSEMCADRTRAEIEEILLREAYEVLEELAEGLPT
jgi:hypothetical protein